MNKRRKTIKVLVAISVAVVMMAAMALPALAQQGPEVRVTHSEQEADQPDVAIDSQGNVHIAYCDVGPGYWEIYYTMLDNNGNTLIDDTMISQGGGDPSRRPAIIVDSHDKVHIVWQQRDYYYDGSDWYRMELYYTKLDPSLDDHDGDAAEESVITEVDDTQLTDFGWYDDGWPSVGPPRIDIDSGDNIHIAFPAYEEMYYYFSGIYYMQIDSDGNVNIDVIELKSCLPWRANPDVAVDSNDDAHITWSDDNNTYVYEGYYMMLDGSSGNTLIDATLITSDDGYNSRRESIVVDFEDKVHIIWTDWRGDLAQIYHTKLDPSLDDQDGDFANEMAITLIDDTALTPDDGHKRNLPTSAIGCGRYVHITWYEDWIWPEGEFTCYLHYMILDWNGSVVVGDTALTTNRTAFTTTRWTMAYLDVDSNGKAHIVWCDTRHMDMYNFDDQLGSPDGQPGRHGGSNNYTEQFGSPLGDDERVRGSNNYTDQLGNSYFWEVYYTNYQGPSCPAAPIGPPNCIYLHCEDGLFNLTAPVDTQWHELWPFFCRQYHLSSWNDTSGNGALSHCDWVDMYEKPDGAVRPYHVEDVTITLVVAPTYGPLAGPPSPAELMYIELEGGYDPAALTDPIGTHWHEIYPNFCTSYNLTEWDDHGNSTLDFCDFIELTEIESENVTWWHVEDVAIDIVVCREPPPVGGEAYPVDKISLLAPWITVGVLLAGGVSWYILRRRRAQS